MIDKRKEQEKKRERYIELHGRLIHGGEEDWSFEYLKFQT